MNQIKTLEEWTEIYNSFPRKNEIIIFKFSPNCGISYKVEIEFDNWAEKIQSKDIQIFKVNVITERSISRKIAEDVMISHQSPQILWFSLVGKIKWHASHYDISAYNLNSILHK